MDSRLITVLSETSQLQRINDSCTVYSEDKSQTVPLFFQLSFAIQNLIVPFSCIEIARSSAGGLRELDVKLTSKIEEDYVPPAYVAYSGVAQTIGASVSNEAFVFSTELLRGLTVPVLEESQPAINIQLRTHDNKRLKLR